MTTTELLLLARRMNTPAEIAEFYTALAKASNCKGEVCAVRVGADWYYVNTYADGGVLLGRPINMVDTDESNVGDWDCVLILKDDETARIVLQGKIAVGVRIVRLP